MKNVAIIYNYVFDVNKMKPTIGGVQTYIFQLCKLIKSINMNPIIIQPSEKNFDIYFEGVRIIGVKFSINIINALLRKNLWKVLYKVALEFVTTTNGIIIFGADQISVKTNYKYAISIVHGIYWDLPSRFYIDSSVYCKMLSKIPFFGRYLVKKCFIDKKIESIRNVNNIVCVDYNFINWYRTYITDNVIENFYIIPNFVEFSIKGEPFLMRHFKYNTIKILFSRRFYEYRGTRIFVEAIKQLIIDNKFKFEVCFAGDGPDEEYIINELKNYDGFKIDKYEHNSSVLYHEDFHIAIIPSLGSEGTSLSAAEAMAAGCAIIATNVGGLSNMIIDNYNGLLIMPCANELYSALNKLLLSDDLRYRLAFNGYNVARDSFNTDIWKNKWKEVICHVATE